MIESWVTLKNDEEPTKVFWKCCGFKNMNNLLLIFISFSEKTQPDFQ